MIDIVLAADVSELASSINGIWVLTVSFLIFFMQPGFVLLEAGQVRSKNVANVAMKNMFDWGLGVLAFFLVGLGVANLVGYATSPGGISLGGSFSYVNSPEEWIGWFFGAVFAMTAATIVSGAVAERIKFRAYVVLSVAITMLIYPAVVGFTWQGGLLSAEGYLGQLVGTGYLDFAGGTVVHMTGGLAGLTIAYLLGARADRYSDDGSSNPLPGHSVLFTVVGTLFLAFGWFGFNVGTQATVLTAEGEYLGAELGRAVLVTTLGMGAGTVGAVVSTAYYQGKPDPIFTANGLLAGLVAVTAGAAHITWWGGILVGFLGGALTYPTYRFTVDTLRIDDVCGVFAVHGSAGAIGVLLIPFVGARTASGWQFLGFDQVLMQAVGVLVIGTWVVAASAVTVFAITAVTQFRMGRDLESSGLDQTEHNIVAYPQFVTDGGTDTTASSTPSSQGTQEADDPMMWRGEEVETTGSATVLDGAGIESFPDPTLVVDETGVLTAINPQALRFFETTEDDALDESPQALVTSAEHSLDAIDEVLRTGQEIRDREGTVIIGAETIPVAVTVTPLHEDGTLVGALATFRNNAEAVATRRHRQTVEEYRESGLESQREKLSELSAGTLEIEPGVPEPPGEHADLEQLQELFRELDGYIIETASNIRAIVEKLPEQSEELAQRSTSLSQSSSEVQASMDDIDGLTTDIEEMTGELRSQTVDASNNVSELSAAIEEITASTADISAQSDDATRLTREQVDEMAGTVERIRQSADRTNEAVDAIDKLEDDMQSVADITDIIQDIATQTNMLALNASIEAANADADSDGFAVVADEVKSLAEETKSSADEIAQIIETAQEQTDTVASVIADTRDEITTGADVVADSVDELETVRERIETTNDGIREISEAVDRQANNVEEVSATMEHVESQTGEIEALTVDISDHVTEEKDEMAAVATLADRFSDIASEVHANIDTFDLGVDLVTGASTR